MEPTIVAILTFVCLVAACLIIMAAYHRLPETHRSDETNATIRLIANIFVTMTSLVRGLTINAANNTFQSINSNIHTFATELILLDRTMRTLGTDANDARRGLIAYVQHVITDVPVVSANAASEKLLDEVGVSLRAIKSNDEPKIALWNDARQQYRQVVQRRWILAEQSEGALPPAMVLMLVAWLVLIFASLGFRAPENRVIIVSFVSATVLVSASMYLILGMNTPFSGPIQVSKQPLLRLLDEIGQ